MASSDSLPPSGDVPDDDAQAERAKRDSLLLLTTIARESGEPLGNVRIRNLSATGVMAECEHNLVSGDRVIIPLRGVGHVTGSVIWVRGGKVGIAFEHEIDPQLARKAPTSGVPPVPTDVPVFYRYVGKAQRLS
jgi:hypothetical protein